MVSKQREVFECQSCGYETPKWLGRCPECQGWNSLERKVELKESTQKGIRQSQSATPKAMAELAESSEDESRHLSGLGEVDRCLGGGVVAGSLLLIGGEPGIGKSTLTFQFLVGLLKENPGRKALYVSGEESVRQIQQRASRLMGKTAEQQEILSRLFLVSETSLEKTEEHLKLTEPQWVIVDSIQTMYSSQIESGSGTIAQLREVALKGLHWAKDLGHTVLLIGHVTKDGAIAGPKLLEHMVDTVVYFEGEGRTGLRLLRTIKNRFGATSEIGVFEMNSSGLEQVQDAAHLYRTIREEKAQVTGSCLSCVMEGTRAFACEIQALVAASGFGNGRRVASGLEAQRISIVGAVIEKFLKIKLADRDVFVATVGGMKLTDPSTDLAIAAAMLSSALSEKLPTSAAFLGEITLTGEVRAASWMDQRIAELNRLGVSQIYVGRLTRKPKSTKSQLIEVNSLKELKEKLWMGRKIDSEPARHGKGSVTFEEELFS